MTGSTTEPDASADALGALVPRRSSLRIALWVLVVGLACALAWMAPAVLRPTVRPDPGHGAGRLLAGTAFVVEDVGIAGQGWPAVTLERVNDRPGARPAGAWLLSEAEVDRLWQAMDAVAGDPGSGGPLAGLDDPRTLFAALVAAGAPLSGPVGVPSTTGLPAELADGATSRLVVFWEVTDCEAGFRDAGFRNEDGDEPDPGTGVTIRTWWGQEQTVTGEFFDGPFWDRETLEEYDICR